MKVLPLPVTVEGSDVLRRAVAGYLARYKGLSRSHTESDLRVFLLWCAERGLDPLAAQRPHIELYVRRMQEVRRFKPSTVSRRISIVAGFYRTCVIDQILASSPAEHVRRPNVPPESPTLGLTHLQFEAMLTAARESTNPNDFALVAMLGLLGLRIFQATGADITDLGEEHGTASSKSTARATGPSSYRSHPRSDAPSTEPSPGAPKVRCYATSEESEWTATPPLFV
jgi:integrase/recombinase XerD